MDYLLPSRTRLITTVLFFGITDSQYRDERFELKMALQNCHMGWMLNSACVNTADDAVAFIQQRPDLEIVQMLNYNERTPEQMRIAGRKIAEAMDQHETKPWVHFDLRESYLIPTFEALDVTMCKSGLCESIRDRWLHRVIALEKAVAA